MGADRAHLVGGPCQRHGSVFGFPPGQLVFGSTDQRLWLVVSGGPGTPPRTGRLPPTRDGAAVSVHVSPARGGNACLAQYARAVRIATDSSAGELGSMGDLHLAVGLAVGWH